jgi:hypothetical protein
VLQGGSFVGWVVAAAGWDDLPAALRVLQAAGFEVSDSRDRLGRRDAKRARRVLIAALDREGQAESDTATGPEAAVLEAEPRRDSSACRASKSKAMPVGGQEIIVSSTPRPPKWPRSRPETVVHLTLDDVIEIHSALTLSSQGRWTPSKLPE